LIKPVQFKTTPVLHGNQQAGKQLEFEQGLTTNNHSAHLDCQHSLKSDKLSQNESLSTGNAASPISTDIIKLLSNFEKHIKYKKVT
jgi:hypothetical protein